MRDQPPPSTSLSRFPEPDGQGPGVEVVGSCSCLPSPASPVTGQVESSLGLTYRPTDRLTGVPTNHLSLSRDILAQLSEPGSGRVGASS